MQNAFEEANERASAAECELERVRRGVATAAASVQGSGGAESPSAIEGENRWRLAQRKQQSIVSRLRTRIGANAASLSLNVFADEPSLSTSKPAAGGGGEGRDAADDPSTPTSRAAAANAFDNVHTPSPQQPRRLPAPAARSASPLGEFVSPPAASITRHTQPLYSANARAAPGTPAGAGTPASPAVARAQATAAAALASVRGAAAALASVREAYDNTPKANRRSKVAAAAARAVKGSGFVAPGKENVGGGGAEKGRGVAGDAEFLNAREPLGRVIM